MRTLYFIWFCFILIPTIVNAQSLKCRDEENKPVDWFVMYKLPKIKGNTNHLISTGLAYTFITSSDVRKGWTISSISINDSLSMPGRTLAPMYNRTQWSDMLWVIHNDEPPGSTYNEELGHTKGVVMSRTTGGVWLVHSVPHFPPNPSETINYNYPHTGIHYGQSFLCISLATQELDQVGIQLKYNQPEIYGSNIPHAMEATVPNLSAAAKKMRISSAPWFRQVQLTSMGGQSFQSFAKTSQFNKELYSDWVAPALQVNLLVQSWLNGQGSLPSDCKHPHIVENVATIDLAIARANFSTHTDHSKWAVAEDKSVPWICVGDINRMLGQEVRGGGTVCMKHIQLWTAYRTSVAGVESCPTKATTTNLVR